MSDECRVSLRKFMKCFLYYALQRAIGRAQKFSKKVQRDLNKAIMDYKQITWSWGTTGFLTELCATSDTRVWGYIYIYKRMTMVIDHFNIILNKISPDVQKRDRVVR